MTPEQLKAKIWNMLDKFRELPHEHLSERILSLFEAERDEMAREIEGLKKKERDCYQTGKGITDNGFGDMIDFYQDKGFNQALSQVLNLIKLTTPPNAGD